MRFWIVMFSLIWLVTGCSASGENQSADFSKGAVFYLDKTFAERARFFRNAFRTTKIHVCTLDRANAEARREAAFKNHPVKDGYDRVEWPLHVCKEGGAGSYVDYVPSDNNRVVENWIQEQLSQYPDGTRLVFRVGKKLEIKALAPPDNDPSRASQGGLFYLFQQSIDFGGKKLHQRAA
jgi:hypothetical protein